MNEKIIDLINKVKDQETLDLIYNLIKAYLEEWGIT